jgi:pimeloyl-ACP methyl ester carboxylesterase
MCNPFGEEAIRAHRVYRVLASQIEGAGHSAMRFDYGCCGDSAGRSIDATLGGWVDDTLIAVEELKRATGAAQVVLMGLRLGASIAALAATRAACRHLILWDPVVEGADYLRELVVAHRTYMRQELGDQWQDDTRVDADGFPLEALGTELSDVLRGGIAGIDLCREIPQAPALTVVCTRATPAMSRLRGVLDTVAGCRWLDILSSADWNSDAALNSATVPIDVVRAIVSRVGEVGT